MSAAKASKASGKTAAVGSVWSFTGKGRVVVRRPDGTDHDAAARDGVVLHVLDVPGVYRCGSQSVTAQ